MSTPDERVEVTPELLDDYLRHCDILEAEGYNTVRLPREELVALVQRIRELESEVDFVQGRDAEPLDP